MPPPAQLSTQFNISFVESLAHQYFPVSRRRQPRTNNKELQRSAPFKLCLREDFHSSSLSPSISFPHQPLLHPGPLVRHDRKPCRVPRNKICGHAMRPQHALELPADACNRRARARVANVGMKTNPKHLPCFKRRRQHQQFRLGVCGCANRPGSEPGVSNLAPVRSSATVLRVPHRPRPPVQIEESR